MRVRRLWPRYCGPLQPESLNHTQYALALGHIYLYVETYSSSYLVEWPAIYSLSSYCGELYLSILSTFRLPIIYNFVDA